MNFDIVVVGGGIAGLTSAAYLSKSGHKVALFEKEIKTGGLVNSFDFNGFTFDGGIRAIENSGMVLPMFRQLGIDIDLVKNDVSIGIEKDIIRLVSKDSLLDYQELLNRQFPDDKEDIQAIINEIKRVRNYMDILYGIDNPLFMDLKNNREYIYKTLLPWMFKYLTSNKSVFKLTTPVDEYLENFTKNKVLIDMIAQHFFKKTPAFFALSYFSLYLDYHYPKGGTGTITKKLEEFILSHGGEIITETKICSIDPQNKSIKDVFGNVYHYKKMIWTADQKFLYKIIDLDKIDDKKIKEKVIAQKKAVSDKLGGDSILSVYLTLDLDKHFFEKICSAHFFYTPQKKGLLSLTSQGLDNSASENSHASLSDDQSILFDWLRNYFELTTYEISCPVLRDAELAPEGKTGLIISTLMDHAVVKHIAEMGWYDAFKTFSEGMIASILDEGIFPGLKSHITGQFTATPLTLENRTGNSEGAITGWAFTNKPIPAVHSMPKVAQSIITPLPDVFQAGQWSFSPSGLPISVLTGKLAANKVMKQLKK